MYSDLRDFLRQLESRGELKRIEAAVSPRLEMTEICRPNAALRAGRRCCSSGLQDTTFPCSAICSARVSGSRCASGRKPSRTCARSASCSRTCKEPEPPKGLRDAWEKFPVCGRCSTWRRRKSAAAPCQEIVLEGAEVDLARLPVQTCWPGDAGPLITWGLTVTRGPTSERQNLGIYRQQVIGRNRVIMRWLAHRGGALDFRDHADRPSGEPFPVAVVLGADPATTLAAVTPVPDTLWRI